MKVKAFLILMVVTVATVMLSAELGERWFAPGMERAVFIGIVTCLVVFPLSRFFEYIGWVKGSWNISGDKDTDDGSDAARAPLVSDAANGPEVTRAVDAGKATKAGPGVVPPDDRSTPPRDR